MVRGRTYVKDYLQYKVCVCHFIPRSIGNACIINYNMHSLVLSQWSTQSHYKIDLYLGNQLECGWSHVVLASWPHHSCCISWWFSFLIGPCCISFLIHHSCILSSIQYWDTLTTTSTCICSVLVISMLHLHRCPGFSHASTTQISMTKCQIMVAC